MAYATTTPAPAPPRQRGSGEEIAGTTLEKLRYSNPMLGMPTAHTTGIVGFEQPHDPASQDIWNEASARVLQAGNHDAEMQANRWWQWHGTSLAPERVAQGPAAQVYTQEQALADYLSAIGQSGAQRDADTRAEFAAAQARAAAGRGGGGRGGGGGGGRRGGGGGSSSGGALIAPRAAAPGLSASELAAYVRSLTPPQPTSRYSSGIAPTGRASGMAGGATYVPTDQPNSRVAPSGGRRAV